LVQDHEIMLSVKNGDINRLGLLFDKYSRDLFNYFRLQLRDSSNSEDLVQNVFYNILKYRHTYRDEADFKAWMYSIARNEKINFFKKRKYSGSELSPEHSDENAVTPEEDLVNKDNTDSLRMALDRISPDNRELIVLSRFSGLPYARIAEIAGCEVGALKVRIYRAMKELKDKFHKVSGEKNDGL
jgi:RNA polymerase sigma factor (sigma-70 family)